MSWYVSGGDIVDQRVFVYDTNSCILAKNRRQNMKKFTWVFPKIGVPPKQPF